MPTIDHDLNLDNDFITGEWTGFCSCGWESSPTTSEGEAVDAWENHCDVVFMEATGG